jgi:HSP20 family protein
MTYYISPFSRNLRRNMIERFMNDNDWNLPVESEVVFPIDVKVEPDAFLITALLPGIKPEDLDIQVVNETVTIHGQLNYQRDEKANYLIQERPNGYFSRVVSLPTTLDPEGAEASVENGILSLRVPKAEAARPKTVKITTK